MVRAMVLALVLAALLPLPAYASSDPCDAGPLSGTIVIENRHATVSDPGVSPAGECFGIAAIGVSGATG